MSSSPPSRYTHAHHSSRIRGQRPAPAVRCRPPDHNYNRTVKSEKVKMRRRRPQVIEEEEEGDEDEDENEGYDDGEAKTTAMTTVSRHYFGYHHSSSSDTFDANDGDDGKQEGAFFLDIIENMQEDYGMFIWPCSIVLADYIWEQRARFLGRSVVEIGAGTSLPGLVAAKVGADVLLTDKSKSEVLDNMKRTVQMNDLHCKVLGLAWGEWDRFLFDLAPDFILGADVFYDTSDFEDLFASVTFLLQKSPQSIFITTYDNRSGHHLIKYLMVKWGWKCTKLLDAFSFMPLCKATKLQGNIQLAEIMLDIEK